MRLRHAASRGLRARGRGGRSRTSPPRRRLTRAGDLRWSLARARARSASRARHGGTSSRARARTLSARPTVLELGRRSSRVRPSFYAPAALASRAAGGAARPRQAAQAAPASAPGGRWRAGARHRGRRARASRRRRASSSPIEARRRARAGDSPRSDRGRVASRLRRRARQLVFSPSLARAPRCGRPPNRRCRDDSTSTAPRRGRTRRRARARAIARAGHVRALPRGEPRPCRRGDFRELRSAKLVTTAPDAHASARAERDAARDACRERAARRRRAARRTTRRGGAARARGFGGVFVFVFGGIGPRRRRRAASSAAR